MSPRGFPVRWIGVPGDRFGYCRHKSALSCPHAKRWETCFIPIGEIRREKKVSGGRCTRASSSQATISCPILCMICNILPPRAVMLLERYTLRGKEAIRLSISQREPIVAENPRRAAMHANKSLGSNSRTWFSTGIMSEFFNFGPLTLPSVLRMLQRVAVDWKSHKSPG